MRHILFTEEKDFIKKILTRDGERGIVSHETGVTLLTETEKS
jgi:hypothetical protein